MQLNVTPQALSKHIDRKKNKFKKVYDLDKTVINNRQMTVVKLTDEDLNILKLAAGQNGQKKESTDLSAALIKNKLDIIDNGLLNLEQQQEINNKQLCNRIEALEQQNKKLLEALEKPFYKRFKLW
jgi:uncharacterized protein (DUF1778 family)